MSLAQLLSLGKKEAPKEDPIPPIESVKAPAAPKLNQDELKLLEEQAGRQAEVVAAQREQEAKEQQQLGAVAKRELEQAAAELAVVAKRRKEENAIAEANAKVQHKSTLCKFYFQGKCDKGAFCAFAHSKEEVASANEKNNSHSGSLKKKFCRFFEIGACVNGEYCSYAHSTEEMQAAEGQLAWGGAQWSGEWGQHQQSWDDASGSSYDAGYRNGSTEAFHSRSQSWSANGASYKNGAGQAQHGSDQYGCGQQRGTGSWTSDQGGGSSNRSGYHTSYDSNGHNSDYRSGHSNDGSSGGSYGRYRDAGGSASHRGAYSTASYGYGSSGGDQNDSSHYDSW